MPLDTAVEPLYRSIPDYAYTLGPEVAELCESAHYTPDANQRDILDAKFAETRHGRPAAFEVAIIGCRQNIKTSVMKMSAIGDLYVLKVRRVVYTAHDWNPACKDMFREMKELIDGSAALSRRVRRIYEGNGEESIDMMSGAQMLFKTRTKAGGRAMAGDKLYFDEGFALQDSHTGSLIPILSTRPDAQIVYGSSAGKPESAVLRDVRDRGRAYKTIGPQAKDPTLAYIEFCAPAPSVACDLGDACDHGRNTPGCGCDKPEMWQLANPAMGRRITAEYIAKERRALSPAEFQRERMGWWDDPAEVADAAIDLSAWDAVVDDDPAHTPETFGAIGIDVAPDRSVASIGIAGRRADGRMYVEWIATRRGTGWLVPALSELAARHPDANIVYDGAGGAAALHEKLVEAGLPIIVLTSPEVVQACGQLADGVDDRTFVHGPQPELHTAVAGTRWRPAGDAGSAFGRRKSDIDITPLYAVTFAAWAAEQSGPSLW